MVSLEAVSGGYSRDPLRGWDRPEENGHREGEVSSCTHFQREDNNNNNNIPSFIHSCPSKSTYPPAAFKSGTSTAQGESGRIM